MDFETVVLILFITAITIVLGFWMGVNSSIEATREEIEQYNSIRLDGVYYYPQEYSNGVK